MGRFGLDHPTGSTIAGRGRSTRRRTDCRSSARCPARSILAAYGYGGNGITFSYLAAELLATFCSGGNSPLLRRLRDRSHRLSRPIIKAFHMGHLGVRWSPIDPEKPIDLLSSPPNLPGPSLPFHSIPFACWLWGGRSAKQGAPPVASLARITRHRLHFLDELGFQIASPEYSVIGLPQEGPTSRPVRAGACRLLQTTTLARTST